MNSILYKKEQLKRIFKFIFSFLCACVINFLLLIAMQGPDWYDCEAAKIELEKGHSNAIGYADEVKIKPRSVYYHFCVKGIRYTGYSLYSISRKQPSEGDTLIICYKVNNPNVNMWMDYLYTPLTAEAKLVRRYYYWKNKH